MTNAPALIGDGIENPWNARVMEAAAAMFGWDCLFRDRGGLAEAWAETGLEGGPLAITREAVRSGYSPVIAFDNAAGADDLYGFRPGGPGPLAVVVGNERRGIAGDMMALADRKVQVPMVSRRINCLNVAAAAGVAMYYLVRGGGRLQTRSDPARNRPELLFLGPGDHVELGSSIRSATAFGWNRLFVEDRAGVWFGVERGVRAEGRAAARRARNPIRVIPVAQGGDFAFEEACIVSCRREGVPLHRVNLARGPRQIVVIPDESAIDGTVEEFERLARSVRFAHLVLPQNEFAYHYRIIATIVLAEIARQVGRRIKPGRRRPGPPVYDSALRLMIAEEAGEIVTLDELTGY